MDIGKGNIKVIQRDGESERNERPLDMLLYYTDKGNISRAKVLDRSGKVLYVKSYNDKLNTVIFQYDDEYGTEKTLGAQTIGYVSALEANMDFMYFLAIALLVVMILLFVISGTGTDAGRHL